MRSSSSDCIIRVAVLSSDSQTLEKDEATLDQYADTYAVGAQSSHSISSSDKQLHVNIEWKTKSMSNSGCDLLALALPHQQSILDSSVHRLTEFAYDCVKGSLLGIVGSTWSMTLPAVLTSFNSESPIAATRVDEIRSSLQNDSAWMRVNASIDPYMFGKEASKLARLALIADELHMQQQVQQVLCKLKPALEVWLTAQNDDVLMYDSTYGGLVSKNGLNDRGADFGQAWYNDHHFHYGYILYAVAVLCRFDSAFGVKHSDSILALARDYANPSLSDSKFAPVRHYDAYDGHSWASGLFAFGDGRNQESSSESVNSYYAIALLGEAMQNSQLELIGRVLLTLELHAVKRYWHMSSSDSVYPSIYTANKCVGMVWGTKIVDATWFASGTAYVHGIQLLPFTPVTEHLLQPHDWLAEETQVMAAGMSASNPSPNDGWLGFLRGSQAVLNSNQAWNDILRLNEYDNGNSKTNLQYWCATRKQN